ncbi:MAG: hypothetical protein WC823_01715 [Parcubacteria group bacterium]|jgi:hypothetical protein
MHKKSSKKPTDVELTIASEAQERAKKDLANFAQNNGHLFDTIDNFKLDVARFGKLADLNGIAQTLTMPAKYLSGLSEQIKSFGDTFQVAVPDHIQETIEMMRRLHEQDGFTQGAIYTPTIRNDVYDMQVSLKQFTKKIEDKMDEKLNEFAKTIDKNSGSYKMEIVREKTGYCKFCDYPLIRVQMMMYFGKSSMKCPNCKRPVQIPDQLIFRDIK